MSHEMPTGAAKPMREDKAFEIEKIEAGGAPRAAFPERPGAHGEVAVPTRGSVLLMVLGHALCSSGLVVVNKWALKEFPFVWTLTLMQFAAAAIVAFVLGKMGVIQVDALEFHRLVHFFPAAGMFFMTITAGNVVVSTSNVDTFIVMRSVVPIPCAILEAIVLKEPCPAKRSWLGLIVVLLGAMGYCITNSELSANSKVWVWLYLVLMPFDGVLIRKIVTTSGLQPWGLVLYNNTCAVLPAIIFSSALELFSPSERGEMASRIAALPMKIAVPALLACIGSLAMSYFQLNVRRAISSTAFAVLGVANKVFAVLLNQLAQLDTNSDLRSIACVLASILGALLFQQSVKGKGISQAPQVDSTKGQLRARIFVGVGILAAAYLAYAQKAAKRAVATP